MEECLLRSTDTTPSPGPGPSPSSSPVPDLQPPPSPSPSSVPSVSTPQHPVCYTGPSRPPSSTLCGRVAEELTSDDVTSRSTSVVTILREDKVLAEDDDGGERGAGEDARTGRSSECGSRASLFASTRSLLREWTPPNTPINTQNIVFNLPSQIWTNDNSSHSEIPTTETDMTPQLVDVVVTADIPKMSSTSEERHTKKLSSSTRPESYASSLFKEIRSMFAGHTSSSTDSQDNVEGHSFESLASQMGSRDILISTHRRSSSAHAHTNRCYSRSPVVAGLEGEGKVHRTGSVHPSGRQLPRTLSEPAGRPFFTPASWSPYLERDARKVAAGCGSGSRACSVEGGSRSWTTSRQSSYDDPVCRICWTNEPNCEPLILPCYCSAHVHEECLRKWLTVAKASSCEVCRYAFPSTRRVKPLRQWKWRMGKSRHFAQFEATLLLLCIVTPPLLCGIILCSKKVAESVDGSNQAWKSTGLMSLVLLSGFTYLVALVFFIRKLRTVCRQLVDNNRTTFITIVPLTYNERYAWKEQGVPSPTIPIRSSLVPDPPPEPEVRQELDHRLPLGINPDQWRRPLADLDMPPTSNVPPTEIWTIST